MSDSKLGAAVDEKMPGDGRIDENKAALRKEMRALRSSLTPEERSCADGAISDRVCTLPEYERADTLFAYLSFGAEVETRAIIERAWQDGKEVALPRCTAPREMRWFKVTDFDGLEKSPIGVEEPRICDELEIMPADRASSLALVPGLTFDEAGYRLGYGGGFYDAFLSEFPGVSVGLCRAVQRSANLIERGVIDSCDKAVDVVVSD